MKTHSLSEIDPLVLGLIEVIVKGYKGRFVLVTQLPGDKPYIRASGFKNSTSLRELLVDVGNSNVEEMKPGQNHVSYDDFVKHVKETQA